MNSLAAFVIKLLNMPNGWGIYTKKIKPQSFIASEKYFFVRYSVGHTDGQADPSYRAAFALENGNMFF